MGEPGGLDVPSARLGVNEDRAGQGQRFHPREAIVGKQNPAIDAWCD
jgi:hypothetical protein